MQFHTYQFMPVNRDPAVHLEPTEKPDAIDIILWMVHRHDVGVELGMQFLDEWESRLDYVQDCRIIAQRLKPSPQFSLTVPKDSLEHKAALEAVQTIACYLKQPKQMFSQTFVRGEIMVSLPSVSCKTKQWAWYVTIYLRNVWAWQCYQEALGKQYSDRKPTAIKESTS